MYKITEVTHINKGYASKAMLVAKDHVKAAYLDLYSSDLDKLVQELVSESRAFKQGNQYYVKK